MPQQYTVRHPSTGQTITFQWNDTRPPTPIDIADVIAEADKQQFSTELSKIDKALPKSPSPPSGSGSPGRQYSATDPQTSRSVTFTWHDPKPPTLDDMNEVFAEARRSHQPASSTNEIQYLDDNGDPIPAPPVYLDDDGNEIAKTTKPSKSTAGFLANIVSDLPSVPKAIWDTAQVLNRNHPLSPASLAHQADNVVRLLNRQRPTLNPEQEAVKSLASTSPAALGETLLDKLRHPTQTLQSVADYAYQHPVSAAMDASAALAGGAGALRVAGRAGRVANALTSASKAIDPVNAAVRTVGAGAQLAGAGADAGGGMLMRKALNMSDADVRARPGVEYTALGQRAWPTREGRQKLEGLLDPLRVQQSQALDQMPPVAITDDSLARINELIEKTARTRESAPAHYDAAVQRKKAVLTGPNLSSPTPSIDGSLPTNGRFPKPVEARLLHENKQALQRQVADARGYIQSPQLSADTAALDANAKDFQHILNALSPEYGRVNDAFSPLMDLATQIDTKALHRSGGDIPYSAGLGIQLARGNPIPAAAGVISSMALKSPRLASGLAQGSYEAGRGLTAAGNAAKFVAPGVNRLNAIQQAVLGLTRDQHRQQQQ